MDGTILELSPNVPMSLDVGHPSPDTRLTGADVGPADGETRISIADVAELVQTPCETHWEPDGPGHSVSDALVKLAGPGQTSPDAPNENAEPGHVADDDHAQIAGLGPYDSDTQIPAAGPDHKASDLGSGRATSDAPNLRAGPDQVGRQGCATPSHAADLDLVLLHASLGHYARQLLDVQKVRVAMANRVASMERDGLPAEWAAPARASMEDLARVERSINSYLERSAKRHPMADWIKDQRGIGLPGFARLLGITGPLDRFATVSKLWAYLGMHVIDGAAPKRQKGERANWSPAGRVLCHQIAESIVKVGAGGPYRVAYDRKKAVYETDRPEWTQARRHNAAMRYAVKKLLKAMWIEWRRCPGLSAARAARMAGASHA